MKFEWDEKKAADNLAKHGVAFDKAILVFNDPNRVDVQDDKKDYGEIRTNTTGQLKDVLIITVTHTDRNGVTRLISARHASRQERKKYHGQNN